MEAAIPIVGKCLYKNTTDVVLSCTGSTCTTLLFAATAVVGYLVTWLWWWDAPLRFKLFRKRLSGNDESVPTLPPGNFGVPFLGHIPSVIWDAMTKHNPDLVQLYKSKLRNLYGPIHCGSLPPLGNRIICLSSDDAIAWALSKENRGIEAGMDRATESILGENSLILLTGKFHQRMRSALLPLFQPTFLRKYAARMNEIMIDHMRDRWGSESSRPRRIRIAKEAKLITLKVIGDLILGMDIDEEYETLEKFIDYLKIMLKGFLMPTISFPGNPYVKAVEARESIKAILMGKIARRRKGKVRRDDALQSLVDPIKIGAGEPIQLSDEQVFDSLLLLLFAGSDTSTSALTFLCKHLIENPDVLSRLREEHRTLRDSRPSPEPGSNSGDCTTSSSITWDEITGLKYTNRVIFESIRLTMPLPGACRTVTEDLVYKNYLFPKGYTVWMDFQNCARHTFSDDAFNPDRFTSDTHLGPLKTKGYRPFGGGARMCLGYRLAISEISVFIHHFVLNYEFRLAPDAGNEVDWIPFPILSDGLPVDVEAV